MNTTFETATGSWHHRFDLGLANWGIQSKEPQTPAVASQSPVIGTSNPISSTQAQAAKDAAIAAQQAIPPPAHNARLVVAHLKVPVTQGKNSKSSDPISNDLPSINDELSPLPVPQSPETPVKRRGLVSLNSFSSMPLVPAALSFNQKDASANNDPIYPRPKANLKTSSSAFVLKVENIPSSSAQAVKNIIQMANSSPTHLITNGFAPVTIGFWTQQKSVLWSDLSVYGLPAMNNQTRISFAIPPSCLSVNQATASHTSMDVLIGFPTGDLVWFDPIAAKYNRINKSGCVTTSPVTSLTWCPLPPPSSSSPSSSAGIGTEHPYANQGLCFLSSHADGTIFTWSTEKDDPQPLSAINNVPTPIYSSSLFDPWTEIDDVIILQPHLNTEEKKMGKPGVSGVGKCNPLSGWKVSRKGLTDLRFAPGLVEGRMVCAVTGEDGMLRVVDVVERKFLDTYSAYFGALTTVCWSPDSRYILTGGQDDLISIYSPTEQRLLARCQGHTSYVGTICFEDSSIAGQVQDYRARAAPRFASVGDDGRILLWDLSGFRPKHQTLSSAQRRISLGSTLSLQATLSRKRTIDSTAHLPLDENRQFCVKHEAPNRKDVSMLQPVVSSLISQDLLSGFAWIPDGFAALTRNGILKIWQRPESRAEGTQFQTSQRGGLRS